MKGNRFLCSTLCLFSCAVSPTLRAQNSGFVYLANFGNAQQPGSILGYAISDNIGALTAVPGPPFQIQLGGGLLNLAVTPSGRFLYAPSATISRQVAHGSRGVSTLSCRYRPFRSLRLCFESAGQ